MVNSEQLEKKVARPSGAKPHGYDYRRDMG